MAVGVHSTQFAIREPRFGLFKPVMELAAATIQTCDRESGRQTVLVAGICAALCASLRWILAVRLDPLLRRIASMQLMNRPSRRAAIAGAVAALLAVGLALGVPRGIEHDWHRFTGGAPAF